MSKDKRCVLIPGYRMSANEWHHVMWGRPEDGKFGRIPKGIQAALLHNADLVYWGGGTDAQQTLEFARKCENELVGLLGDKVRPFLHKRAHIGREGTRTTAEIAEAMLI